MPLALTASIPGMPIQKGLAAKAVNPPVVTVNGCGPAFAGTVTTSCVADAEVTVAFTVPNNTMLLLAVALNPEPSMVTAVPTGPLVGEKLLMVGCAKITWENNIKRKLMLLLRMAIPAATAGRLGIGFILGFSNYPKNRRKKKHLQ